MQNSRPQSIEEERLNALSHLAASGFYALLYLTADSLIQMIYCTSFTIMFFASYLYHNAKKAKELYRLIDQSFIYVVMGVTGLCGAVNISIFCKILILAGLGMTLVYHSLRLLFNMPEGYLIPFLYFLNGAFIAICLLLSAGPIKIFLISALASYVVGFALYVCDHKKYFHFGWHIMCLLGSVLMYKHVSILA